MTTTLLPASILPGLLEVSLRGRLDVQALFDQAGIDAEIVGRSDCFISLAQLDELLYTAFSQTDDPLFGLHVGADNHYGNLDLLGNMMATAATLRDGLDVLFAYKDLVVPYLSFSLTSHDGQTRLAVTGREPGLRFIATRSHNEVVVAIMVAIGRSLLAGTFPVRDVYFCHPPLPASLMDAYRDFFRCPLHFEAPDNAIVFDSAVLAQPLPRAYPKYHQRLKHAADQVLAGLSRAAGVSGKVIEQLTALLGERALTMENVARELALTPRTLQRRLRREGTGFAQLRDRVRHQHACQALQADQCDMQALAHYLGFSDTANFYHAFKRWQGCAPGQYRRRCC